MAEQTQHPVSKAGDTDKDKRSTEQRLADLELQLAQTRAGLPGGTLPYHSAGVEDEIAETWSQHDQELANAGEHPDQ
jgi:hypothetical protein